LNLPAPVLLASAAAAAIALYATAYEPFAIRLRRLRLNCPRLPTEFDGFTILQLSDLHMSKMGRRERRVTRMIRDLSPDILAITGDLAFDDVSGRQLAAMALGARPREGAFAISGNADVRHPGFYAGVRRVMREAGIRFLENEHIMLRRGGASIVIAGVDDPHSGRDDLGRAVEGAPDDRFTLLLSHTPAIIVAAIEVGADVVLSGHTHGGQLALPFIGPLYTRSGHGKGLAAGLLGGESLRKVIDLDPGRTQVYVSRGIGSSFLPLRFLAPPEIALLELRRG
jgi:hypothetical protein